MNHLIIALAQHLSLLGQQNTAEKVKEVLGGTATMIMLKVHLEKANMDSRIVKYRQNYNCRNVDV